jgi:hypothetical protein
MDLAEKRINQKVFIKRKVCSIPNHVTVSRYGQYLETYIHIVVEQFPYFYIKSRPSNEYVQF